jgi:hypothetical protein
MKKRKNTDKKSINILRDDLKIIYDIRGIIETSVTL